MSNVKRDWKKIHDEYESSGMDLEAYAEKAGLSVSWLKRGLKKGQEEKEFIPVAVRKEDAEPYAAGVIRVKAGKLIIEISSEAGEEVLCHVLTAAEKAC